MTDVGRGMYLRFPDEQTKQAFKAYSKARSRSMNGQIVEMIKAVLNPSSTKRKDKEA